MVILPTTRSPLSAPGHHGAPCKLSLLSFRSVTATAVVVVVFVLATQSAGPLEVLLCHINRTTTTATTRNGNTDKTKITSSTTNVDGSSGGGGVEIFHENNKHETEVTSKTDKHKKKKKVDDVENVVPLEAEDKKEELDDNDDDYDGDDPFHLGSPVTMPMEGMQFSKALPQPPPPPPQKLSSSQSLCSCWSNVSTTKCCERTVYTNHKFGFELAHDLFDKRRTNHTATATVTQKVPANVTEYFHRSADYRSVFVARDLYEAIVSGYLYHKTGAECWLSPYGEPHFKKERDDKTNFETTYLSLPEPYPAVQGRDLCLYLQQESETDGLRVYIEWAMRRYYAAFVRLYKAVLLRRQQQHQQQHDDESNSSSQRTMFVCFEQLNDPKTNAATFTQMQSWLYPGRQLREIPSSLLRTTDYAGAHSTPHDPELRDRLKRIIRSLDSRVFHGTVNSSSALFGCGEDSS